MFHTVIKHSGHLRTLEKCKEHSPVAHVFVINSNYIKNNTWAHGDMKFILECSTRYLRSEHSRSIIHPLASKDKISPYRFDKMQREHKYICLYYCQILKDKSNICSTTKTTDTISKLTKSKCNEKLYLYQHL